MVIVMLMSMHAQMYQPKKIQEEQIIAALIQLQDVILAHFIWLLVTLKIPGVQVHNEIQHLPNVNPNYLNSWSKSQPYLRTV